MCLNWLVIDRVGLFELILLGFLPICLVFIITIVAMIVSPRIFKTQAKEQSAVPSELYSKAHGLATKILPHSIWFPIYIKVIPSSEIYVRLHSHFFHVSTAAIQSLTEQELAFHLKSEYNYAKIFHRKYLWISLIPGTSMFVPLAFILWSNNLAYAGPFIIAYSFITIPMMPIITKWARKDADKWRKLGDEQTVAEIPHPQVASTAVQKSIRSAVADSAQTPYQLSMKRLEAVENAIRLRETT